MHPAFAVLLASLCADTGTVPDGGLPLWAPRLKRADVEDAATYGLRRWGEGYFWENAKFEARVGRDGLVTFKDKHGSMALSGFPFSFLPKATQRSRNPLDGVRPPDSASRRGPWLEPPRQPPVSDRKMDQTVLCPPGSSCYALPTANMVEVNGTFDLTDEIMRGLGQDPYGLEKARFLSATFEFRIKLAIEARKADLKRALDRLPEALDELWGDGRYSARERRRSLYELWYEMDQSLEGERAARTIDQFIRRRLPCGSPDGYPKGELDGFAKAHPEGHLSPGAGCEP